MLPNDVKKLLMAISVAYPYYAKQQIELGKTHQLVTANVWEMALADVEYADASNALARHIKQNKFAPSPAEIIELSRMFTLDPMDSMAMQDAEYRRMFPGWVNDGLNRGQRMERMERANLEAGERVGYLANG